MKEEGLVPVAVVLEVAAVVVLAELEAVVELAEDDHGEVAVDVGVDDSVTLLAMQREARWVPAAWTSSTDMRSSD